MLKLSWLSFFLLLRFKEYQKKKSWFDSSFRKYFWLFMHWTIQLQSGLCCIEDLITPYYWSCSVLIILTNQSLLLFDSKYCGSFDLLIWVDYMSEVARKLNNKTTFIIKITELHYLIGRNIDTICKLQSSYKVQLNTISNVELSDPLCESVNRGLTLVNLCIGYLLLTNQTI